MRLSKTTSDGFFTITVESSEMDDLGDGDPIPIESIEALISELEALRAQLIGFIIQTEKGPLVAN